MTLQLSTASRLAEILGRRDRRAADRRDGDRRGKTLAVVVERRRGTERRTVGQRETANGHIRQALQLLETRLAPETLETSAQRDMAAAVRRLWLAVRECELGNVGRYR